MGLPRGSQEDPEQNGNFVFVEKWKDETAIKQHEETAHFKKFFEGIEKLLRETSTCRII